MKFKKVIPRLQVLVLAGVAFLLASWPAAAAGLEISAGLSFSRSSYGDGNYSWTRRWGSSVGYEFNDRSEIEFAFQEVLDRTYIEGYQDTTFHDEVYSFNWVQNLLGRNSPLQPYVKVGIGQLNRDASGVYAGGSSPPKRLDVVTGVLGGGTRLYLTRSFAIRFEVTSYLEGGNIRTWQDNVGATLGLSINL